MSKTKYTSKLIDTQMIKWVQKIKQPKSWVKGGYKSDTSLQLLRLRSCVENIAQISVLKTKKSGRTQEAPMRCVLPTPGRNCGVQGTALRSPHTSAHHHTAAIYKETNNNNQQTTTVVTTNVECKEPPWYPHTPSHCRQDSEQQINNNSKKTKNQQTKTGTALRVSTHLRSPSHFRHKYKKKQTRMRQM